MKIASVLLQVFAVCLAVLQAMALFVFALLIPIYQPKTIETEPINKSHYVTIELPSHAPASGILSRLGLLMSETRERQFVAVVIENHEDARPHHRGINEALVVQEWMVEGLISRFIALYDVADLPEQIGPVRSLRKYMVEGVIPWTNSIIYAGGSPDATDWVENDDTFNSVNGLRGAYYFDFVRDDDIAEPHNLFLSGSTVPVFLSGAQVPVVTWPEYETGPAPLAAGSGSEVRTLTGVKVQYYNPLHNVYLTYDTKAGHYNRRNGTVENHAQPKNVIFLEVPILEFGELGRLNMPIPPKGKLFLLRSGKLYEGFYLKANEETPWQFVDTDLKPLTLARGQVWMTALPTLERVEF